MSIRTLWKVKVDVHQVYNLRLADSNELPDPYIAATLDLPRVSSDADPVQRTISKNKTSSGTFNSVMLFIANIYDFDFNKVKILIRVHNDKRLTQVFESDGVLIGTTAFSLSSVYAQPKHWIPREWFPITSPTSPGDCRGYVQVSVGVFGPGDDVPTQLSDFQLIQGNEKNSTSLSIREKIVLTPETNFHNCMLIFNIIRAENLPVLYSGQQMLPTSGYVKVIFVGVSMTTRVVQSNANPAWNETIRIPVLCPSWDQYVLVEVYSRGQSTSLLGKRSSAEKSDSDLLLGSATFDFNTLYKTGIQPTWFNIYSSSSAKIDSFGALYGGEYSGRVLVSGSVSRSSDVNANVIPLDSSTVVDPPTDEIVVYVDVYELAFFDEALKAEDVPNELWLQVEFGPNTFESHHVVGSGMTCIFNQTLGRMEPFRIHLPVDRVMAYDMVLSVYGLSPSGDKRRVCYTRLAIEKFLLSISTASTIVTDPEWLKLYRMASNQVSVVKSLVSDLTSFFGSSASSVEEVEEQDQIQSVANILATIAAFKIGKGQFPDRPDRIPYNMTMYELRLSVHQACNLPLSPNGSLSSTFCRATLAGVCARTSVIPHTLYPVWNDSLRIEVDLPQTASLRPDLTLEVIDKPTGITLGVVSIKTSSLRPQMGGAPTWYRMQSPNKSIVVGKSQESYILCSAALVPADEIAKIPIPSALPQRTTFTVDLLIVGIRLIRNYSIENLYRVEVCWGRYKDNPNKRVVSIRTNDPIGGEGGQFNFLQPALMDLDLPVDSVFQEFLEIRLIEESSAQAKPPVAFGYLHLNPHYGWITENEQIEYRDLFRLKTQEELRKLEERTNDSAHVSTDYYRPDKKRGTKISSKKRKANKDELEIEYIESEINERFGIDIDQNYIELPVQAFNSIETDLLLPRNESRIKNSQFMKEFIWEPTVTNKTSEKEEIFYEFDSLLEPDQLPFVSVPLVVRSPTEESQYIVIGYLKVRCRVREKSDDSTELLALQSEFTSQFDDCVHLVSRLYVLRAEGIVPSSRGKEITGAATTSTASSGGSSYYLWVRNISGELIETYPNCSIKDDGTIEYEASTNPEFNKCFQLPCSFPENSVLYIELYERRTGIVASNIGSDILIGSVMIDIENRWFHPRYQELIEMKGGIPIETLTLRDAVGIPKGKLRCFLEIMDQVTSMGRPIETLPSPQPEQLEVRIVLWRTRGVANPDGEEQSHQGVSIYMQSLDTQSSDTHYGSLDGTGTFNWRFVLNPTVPTEDSAIRFQLQHRPIVGLSNVAIGEVTLDLSHELGTVRRTRRGIDLPRCWVPVTHPAYVGKVRGQIEIQIRILSGEEARSFPVGKGRELPNSDPFLDGDDPHLLQHRNALANTVVGRSLAKFVDAMKSGIRIATILFIIGWIVSGIVGLILLLISMGIIKIN